MRILVYSNCPLDPSLGSGKVRVRLSEGLRARGHEVEVIEPSQIEWRPGLRAGRRFRIALGALLHLRRRLARERFDVVEIDGGEFGWLAWWLFRQRRRPLLVHRTDGCELMVDDGPAPAGGRRWRQFFSRLHAQLNVASFTHIDACVTVCGLDRRFLVETKRLAADAVRAVPNAVDDEFLAYPEPGPRPARLVFFGSWIERKGVSTLVESATAVMTATPGLELDVLGGCRPAEVVRAAFPEALRSRIHVAGRLEIHELAARLARSSILVFPTRYEGYGMATAEAMACGCAVITTPTGFGGDLHDGVDSLVVPVGNAAALTAAVHRLVNDSELRLQLARAGWQRVQTHRWVESVRLIEDAYATWLNRRAAATAGG